MKHKPHPFGSQLPLTQALVNSVDYRKRIGYERFELRRRALEETMKGENDVEDEVANEETN